MTKLKILAVFSLLLLLSACSEQTIDTSVDYKSELKDGTYSASSVHYGTFGFKKKITIGVHDGIISEVNFSEYNKDGVLKEDLEGSKRPWSGCQYAYDELKPILYENTILTQGTRIDTVTGATKTSEDYKKLLDVALKEAQSGRNLNQEVDTFNDTYTVLGELDPLTQTREELVAEYSNGELTSIEVREYSPVSDTRRTTNDYSNLIDLSLKEKSDENVSSSTTSTELLTRYNNLLTKLRELREN